MRQARRFTAIPAAVLLLASGCGEKPPPSEPDLPPAAAPAARPETTSPKGPPARAISEERPVPDVRPAAPEVTGPVRRPVVAGSFYPGSPKKLRAKVEGYLAAAKKIELPGRVIAIIAPHAGYAYSGPAAGWAYKQVEGADGDAVVLIGGHSGVLPYGAVYAGGAYGSPLGDCPVDAGLAGALVRAGGALRDDRRPHESPMPGWGRADHAMEVHVPFIQVALPRARIAPVYFNMADPETAARVGEGIAGATSGRKAVIVCSTDLSHYRPVETAEVIDRGILEAICTLDAAGIVAADARLMREHGGKRGESAACGLGAVLATVEAAKRLGATGARVVRYDHSGNYVRKDPSRVVGYAAVAIYGGARARLPARGDRMLSDGERKMLLSLARKSVALAFEKKSVPRLQGLPPPLRAKAAAFVTLTNRGRLRGCIGTFGRGTELWRVVAEYARMAAFRDRRFRPLTKAELAQVEFEISVLSPLRKLEHPLDIRLGTDGIWIVGAGGQKGTYLPQVARHFKTKEEFLSDCTKKKAGLAADAWRDPNKATVYAYTAEVFSEEGEKH